MTCRDMGVIRKSENFRKLLRYERKFKVIRVVRNTFNFIRLMVARFILFFPGGLLNLILYKRLSHSLVVSKITKRLNMDLTHYRYTKIRNAISDEEKLTQLIDDFVEALNKLEPNRTYKVNVNNGVYSKLVLKLRSKRPFEIRIVKKKIKMQMIERSLLMKISVLFETLILTQNTDIEEFLYKKVTMLELRIIKK